jgi:hypothetical protein
MSSELLPLPEIWSDPPKGDVPQSVRADVVANGRSGLVLVEYASGYAQADPQPVVRPPDRAEQSGGPIPSFAAAALARGLSDLSAIVTQAEALLRAQGTLKGDVHFAVERIHDVALALRMRDVNAVLCDTLDASVREVGDAVVRHEAAATGALSAAALLRDILNRIEDLTHVASGMTAPGAEPLAEPPGDAEVAVAVAAPARPATEVKALVAAFAPAAFDAQVAAERPSPVLPEAEPSIEAPAPAASQAQAVIEASTPAIEAPTSAIEAPTPVNEAWPGPAAEESADFAAGPRAYRAPAPEADKADPPMTAAVDMMKADNVMSEGVAFDDVMPGPAVSEGHHPPASLDADCDSLAAGADSSREPQPVVEPDDAQTFAIIEPAAPPAQAEIKLADETEVANEISVAYEVEGTDGIDVAAETVVSEIAGDQNHAAATPPVIEAAIAATATATAMESRERDPQQLVSSVVVDESATTVETLPRRPLNDPLAAFYGLTEAELIALFT